MPVKRSVLVDTAADGCVRPYSFIRVVFVDGKSLSYAVGVEETERSTAPSVAAIVC